MAEELDKDVVAAAAESTTDTDEASQVDLEQAVEIEASTEPPEQLDTPVVPPLVVVEEPEVIDDDGRTPGITEKIDSK